MIQESRGLDPEFAKRLSAEQRQILEDPAHYQGAAADRTRAGSLAAWEKRVAELVP